MVKMLMFLVLLLPSPSPPHIIHYFFLNNGVRIVYLIYELCLFPSLIATEGWEQIPCA